jgi:hypothetical protein
MIQNTSTIDGFYDFEDIYQKFVDECPDGGKLLEIGVFKGASIIGLAQLVKESGKNIEIWGVDDWQNNHIYNTFFANTIQQGVTHMIKPVRAPSGIAYIGFPANIFFAAFIDADHRFSAVVEDVTHYLPKVTKYLAGHDIHLPSVKLGLSKTIGNDYEVIGKSWIYEK